MLRRAALERSDRPRRALVAVVSLLVSTWLASGLLACGGSTEDRIAEIKALQDAGQFSESIESLRELLAREPDQPEANYLLGVALVQTGQPSLAVWPLEKAVTAPDYVVPAGLLLGATFLQINAFEDAVRVADKVLEADPDRTAALRVRAQALLGANRREDALADAQRLYRATPEDFQAGLLYGTILAELGRTEEAEKVHAEIEAAAARSQDPSIAVRGCLARASFFEDNLEDDARAEVHYRRCLEQAPTDPFALRLVTAFFDARKRADESTAIWRAAVEKAPESLAFRQALAARYEAIGKGEDARKLLTEGVELLGSTQAWVALADLERRTGHPEAALAAVEQAQKVSPMRSEQLLFLQGDLLIDAGRLDDAEKLVEDLQETSFRELLKGRILLERGEPQAALAAFEAGVRRWPNNAGGRYLAGLAAREIGDVERAVSELRESVRADASVSDAALVLATLEYARGNYRDAVEAAQIFIEMRGGGRPDGYQVAVRALLAQDLHDHARRIVEQMREAGFAREAAVAGAQVEADAAGPAAGVEALRKSRLDPGDPANEPVLRALADFLVSAGRTEEALTLVERALARNAEIGSLHELRGIVLLRLGRTGDARAAFEKALALGSSRAKSGLAEIARSEGDGARAIALYDEAAKSNPLDVAPAYAAAQIALFTGDRLGAKRRLEDVLRRDPGHAAAHNDLAWLLAQSGEDLDRALALAQTAHRIEPSPDVADTLGWVHLQRGDYAAAVQLFEEALAARPDSPSMRYHLGLALARQGERQRALETLRQALESGPFPEADAARSELARLEGS